MKQMPEIHRMEQGEQRTLTVKANERYSMQRIAVRAGERYLVKCDSGQRWVDMVIWSSPLGYPNPLARLFGLPVRNARCFCLCGTYNETDTNAFAIGTEYLVEHIASDAILSFFANDVRGFEWNNWGSVQVEVTRLA